MTHPAAEHWPPARVRVVTRRLELRLPSDEELVELIAVVDDGVHPPEQMPFAQPWTDAAPTERARSLLQWHWSQRGSWTPDRWAFLFGAFVDGKIVGAQDVAGRQFATRREVSSGSWLGQRWHGRGLGTEMREAMLHLAFAGLGAEHAVSSASSENPASIRVSEKAGYERDGIEVHARTRGAEAPEHLRGERIADPTIRFRITREAWVERRRADIELHGIDDDLLAMVGVGPG